LCDAYNDACFEICPDCYECDAYGETCVPSDICEQVVSPNSLGCWVVQTAGGATATFVAGPGTPPLSTGSLQVNVGANGDDFGMVHCNAYAGTPLASIDELGYCTFTQQDTTPVADGDQTVYLSFRVDYTGDNTEDDRLYFEPEYQHGYTVNVPDQNNNTLLEWQCWNALTGGWWSLNGTAGAGPGADVKTLAQILAVQPNATIVNNGLFGGVRLIAGGGAGAWDNHIGNTDRLTIGVNGISTTYDFEPGP
jgi:hypothetical protein